jgi:hypothetical protein
VSGSQLFYDKYIQINYDLNLFSFVFFTGDVYAYMSKPSFKNIGTTSILEAVNFAGLAVALLQMVILVSQLALLVELWPQCQHGLSKSANS